MNYADSTILKRKLTAWFNVNEEMKLVVCLIKLNTCQPGTVSTEVKPPPTRPKENKFIVPYKCSVHIQTLYQLHTDATKLIIYLFLLSHLLLPFLSTTSFHSCLMDTQVDSERLFMMRLLSDDSTWWVLEKGSVVLGMTTSQLPSTLWEGTEWFGAETQVSALSAWGKNLVHTLQSSGNTFRIDRRYVSVSFILV
jgi:hypothetical protein